MKKATRILKGIFLLALGCWLMKLGAEKVNIIIGALQWGLGIYVGVMGWDKLFTRND